MAARQRARLPPTRMLNRGARGPCHRGNNSTGGGREREREGVAPWHPLKLGMGRSGLGGLGSDLNQQNNQETTWIMILKIPHQRKQCSLWAVCIGCGYSFIINSPNYYSHLLFVPRSTDTTCGFAYFSLIKHKLFIWVLTFYESTTYFTFYDSCLETDFQSFLTSVERVHFRAAY